MQEADAPVSGQRPGASLKLYCWKAGLRATSWVTVVRGWPCPGLGRGVGDHADMPPRC